jgi:protoporphyrinogen/coproporphyrinogen III oxidase
MTTITIIGGGISGLAATIAIQQQAGAAGLELNLRVVEKESRLGGKIWSIQEQGYLCEWGPNGFLDNKPMTLDLCREIGIDSNLLRSNDNARKRFIYSGAVLHQLPETGPAFLQSKLISWPGKLRLAMEPLIPAYRGDKDETLADFGRRRLGAEALDKLIAPMVSGIFAGNPETMSLKSCFPRIHQLEREYGGLIKAMVKLAKQKKAERKAGKTVAGAAGPGGVLTSFQEGIQELTDGIAYELRCEIHTGTEVSGISKSADGFKLTLADGTSMESDLVISASPAFAVAEMVTQLDHGLAELLRSIPYAPMNVVCFGYQQDKIRHTLDGFGYLIPKKEGCHTLGTLWDSSIFPNRAPEGHVLLRSMLGGATNPKAMELDEAQIAGQVKADLRGIMGIDADPDFTRVFRHPQAIPQYTVGHQRKLNALQEALGHHPGLFLTGNAYLGIGLNDCVNAANSIAAEVIAELTQRQG